MTVHIVCISIEAADVGVGGAHFNYISYLLFSKNMENGKILILHSHWQPLIDVALADGTLQIACRRLESNPVLAEGGSTSPGVERLNYIAVSAADSAFSKPLRARLM